MQILLLEKMFSLLKEVQRLQLCPQVRRRSRVLPMLDQLLILIILKVSWSFPLKRQRGMGSYLGKSTNAGGDVVDEGCGSSLGKGGSRPSYTPSQGAGKAGGDVRMEDGSSKVHDFDVKVLCDD